MGNYFDDHGDTHTVSDGDSQPTPISSGWLTDTVPNEEARFTALALLQKHHEAYHTPRAIYDVYVEICAYNEFHPPDFLDNTPGTELTSEDLSTPFTQGLHSFKEKLQFHARTAGTLETRTQNRMTEYTLSLDPLSPTDVIELIHTTGDIDIPPLQELPISH